MHRSRGCARIARAATNIDRPQEIVNVDVGHLRGCHLSHPFLALSMPAVRHMGTFGGSWEGKHSPAFTSDAVEFVV